MKKYFKELPFAGFGVLLVLGFILIVEGWFI